MQLDEFTIRLAKQIAVEVIREWRNGDAGWVAQDASELGPRRHCRIVRQLVARKAPGATIVGDRFLLEPTVYADERLKMGHAVVKAEPEQPTQDDVHGRIMRRLGSR